MSVCSREKKEKSRGTSPVNRNGVPTNVPACHKKSFLAQGLQSGSQIGMRRRCVHRLCQRIISHSYECSQWSFQSNQTSPVAWQQHLACPFSISTPSPTWHPRPTSRSSRFSFRWARISDSSTGGLPFYAGRPQFRRKPLFRS